MLINKKEYHFSKSLDSYPEEKEPKNTDDKMRSGFSESLDKFPSKHNYGCRHYSGTQNRYYSIHNTISMHRYHICHTRSWERERKCERNDESLIEIFMDEMISLDFIDLGSIGFFSLYHRESDKEEDYRSCDAKIFCFEAKKWEEILSKEVGSKHRKEKDETKPCPILSVVFPSSIRMESSIEWERCEWFKESNEWEKHCSDKSHIEEIKHK